MHLRLKKLNLFKSLLIMNKTNKQKLSLEKFTVSKINNQQKIFGGSGTKDGPATLRPTAKKTRPTKK